MLFLSEELRKHYEILSTSKNKITGVLFCMNVFLHPLDGQNKLLSLF